MLRLPLEIVLVVQVIVTRVEFTLVTVTLLTTGAVVSIVKLELAEIPVPFRPVAIAYQVYVPSERLVQLYVTGVLLKTLMEVLITPPVEL